MIFQYPPNPSIKSTPPGNKKKPPENPAAWKRFEGVLTPYGWPVGPGYLISRWTVWRLRNLLYFLSSMREVVFFLFFTV